MSVASIDYSNSTVGVTHTSTAITTAASEPFVAVSALDITPFTKTFTIGSYGTAGIQLSGLNSETALPGYVTAPTTDTLWYTNDALSILGTGATTPVPALDLSSIFKSSYADFNALGDDMQLALQAIPDWYNSEAVTITFTGFTMTTGSGVSAAITLTDAATLSETIGKLFDGDNTIIGSQYDDALDGGSGNNQIDGGLGADTISGGEGDDTIDGGAGSDMIDGGDGTADIVVYSGAWRTYTITASGGTIEVQDASDTDTITNVELITFANGTFAAEDIANDDPTSLAMSSTEVSEMATVGTVVGTLSAIDADTDLGDTLTYSLEADESQNFAIIDNKLVLAEGAKLNAETAASHTIVVRATDSQGAFTETTLDITVTNVNEAPQALTLSNSSIDENAANGTTVGLLSGTDPDSGETLTYQLLSDAGGRFTLLGNEIVVANGLLLDYEQNKSHTISVRVQDEGGLYIDRSFTINVSDLGSETVSGNNEANTIFAGSGNDTLSGMGGADTLNGGNGDDTLTGGLGADTINGGGGTNDRAIYSADWKDYIISKSGSILTISGPDGTDTVSNVETFTFANGTFSATEILNDTPTDLAISNATIDENSAGGTVIGILSATDVDSALGDAMTYSLVSDESNKFAVVDNKLILANGASLDSEAAASHTVVVRATDVHGAFTNLTVNVSVEDTNEAPAGLTLSSSTVVENASDGATIGTLSATDPDIGDILTYQLLSDNNGRFALSGNTLVVGKGFLLDFEQSETHTITVRVQDAAGVSTDSSFTINVSDQNVENVTGDNAANTIQGGDGDDTLIGLDGADTLIGGDGNDTLTGGMDADTIDGGDGANDTATYSGDWKTYSISQAAGGYTISGSEGNDQVTNVERFSFANGTFAAAAILNDAPTSLTISSSTISEAATGGTFIGNLTASDADTALGDNIAYSIVSDPSKNFAIENNTLILANGASLNAEAASSHSVVIRATDSHGAFINTTVKVAVQNVNERPTGLTLSASTVLEDASNGSTIGTLVGIDPDNGERLTYQLVSSAGGRFAISGNKLTVGNGLLFDYEQAKTHLVTVRVKDAAGLTYDRTFSISVRDQNPENVSGNNTANTFIGGAGNDTLAGLGGADTLTGNAGADIINGGAGVDTITGGIGRDTMSGGSDRDRDTFVFTSLQDTGKTATTRDKITDFVHLTDKINLSGIDANTATAGNSAFQLLSTAGTNFTGIRGQLRWFQENPTGTANDKTIIEGDVNGDRVADFQIELTGIHTLSTTDFIL